MIHRSHYWHLAAVGGTQQSPLVHRRLRYIAAQGTENPVPMQINRQICMEVLLDETEQQNDKETIRMTQEIRNKNTPT